MPQVAVVPVVRKDLSSSITSNGKVEPVTPYFLRAKFDGFVNQIPVVENQNVTKGQLLLTMDDVPTLAPNSIRCDPSSPLRKTVCGQRKWRPRSDQAAQAADELHSAQVQRDQLQREQEVLAKLVPQKAATPNEVESKTVLL